jgi:hypothetical protein
VTSSCSYQSSATMLSYASYLLISFALHVCSQVERMLESLSVSSLICGSLFIVVASQQAHPLVKIAHVSVVEANLCWLSTLAHQRLAPIKHLSLAVDGLEEGERL